MSKLVLRCMKKLFSCVIALILVIALLYSGYALWDNGQIYASAENVMNEAQNIKGQTISGENVESETDDATADDAGSTQKTDLQTLFEQLWEINPDIRAWLIMNGTTIDYPVVQGKNNIDYVSTDIYGNFSIIGSIFLDFRNIQDGSDTYNLLYGHNMAEHKMFGDVNEYKQEEFFQKNQKGAYYTPDAIHSLQTISVIVTKASDSYFFNPAPWETMNYETMLELVQRDAVFTSEEGMKALRMKIEAGENPHIVALSTCSGEFTDARTILLTLMDPDEVPDGAVEGTSEEVSDETPEELPEGQEAER